MVISQNAMGKRILIADDSVTIQKAFAMTLGSEDFALTAARSADEGLTLARQTRPDLVIADASMPGRSGYELCAALKADAALRAIPVYILSSTQQPYDEAKGQQVGADGTLIKPWDSTALIEKLKDAAGRPAGAARARPRRRRGARAASDERAPHGGARRRLSRSTWTAPRDTAPAPARTTALVDARRAGDAAARRRAPRPRARRAARGLAARRHAPVADPGHSSGRDAARASRHLAVAHARRAAPHGPVGAAAARRGRRADGPHALRPARPPACRSRARRGPRPRASLPRRAARPRRARARAAPRSRARVRAARPRTRRADLRARARWSRGRPCRRRCRPPWASLVDQKVAAIAARGPEYEALAKLSREVIEQIVWEIVPELAEAIIREHVAKRGTV